MDRCFFFLILFSSDISAICSQLYKDTLLCLLRNSSFICKVHIIIFAPLSRELHTKRCSKGSRLLLLKVHDIAPYMSALLSTSRYFNFYIPCAEDFLSRYKLAF